MKSTLVVASTTPGGVPVKADAEAVKVVEDMQRKGVQVQRLPPADQTRTLAYAVLSDFLDAVVLDIHRVCPEIFASTAPIQVLPGRLKAYLYCIVMHHFKITGCLVNAGGIQLPSAAGSACPTPLLAYLQYIGVYSEGDTTARARYSVPSTVPVVGTVGIVNGSVAETAIANSSQNFTLSGYTLNTTFGEYASGTNTADANNIITNWVNNADNYSDALESSNYPTMPMWGVAPPVPDASYFANYNRNSTTTGAGDAFFSNCFDNWDHEISVLYNLTTPTGNFGVSFANRPGPMSSEWPITVSTYEDMMWARKKMFIFILRHCTYAPGMSTEQIRYYHGDRLRSFMIVPIVLKFNAFAELVAKVALQLITLTGATVGAALSLQLFALIQVCNHAMGRRVQLMTISDHASQTLTPTMFQPSNADTLVVPAPVAQLINDCGPVVRDGMLHIPLVNQVFTWYQFWNSFGINASTLVNLGNSALLKTAATNDPVIVFRASGTGDITVNATYNTNWSAVAGSGLWSWTCIQYLHEVLTQWISTGNNYGKGDFLYPVSKGPRGGLCMFAKDVLASAIVVDTVVGVAGAASALTLQYYPLTQIGSYVPITGAEIAMTALTRYSEGSATQMSTAKYLRNYAGTGQNSFVDRFVSQILGPGGTFQEALAAAMEKRHGMMMDSSSGLVSSNDNIDACLWDAIKSVAGTIAGALQPAASKAAGIGCGAIPFVGQFAKPLCESAASNLVRFAADSAKSSTNRHAINTAKGELGKFKGTVKGMKAVEDQQLSEERPPLRRGSRADYMDDESMYGDDGERDEYRRPRRTRKTSYKPRGGKPSGAKGKKKPKQKSRKRRG